MKCFQVVLTHRFLTETGLMSWGGLDASWHSPLQCLLLLDRAKEKGLEVDPKNKSVGHKKVSGKKAVGNSR